MSNIKQYELNRLPVRVYGLMSPHEYRPGVALSRQKLMDNYSWDYTIEFADGHRETVFAEYVLFEEDCVAQSTDVAVGPVCPE